MRFTIVKKTTESSQIIKDIFLMIIGLGSKVLEKDEYLIFYHSFENDKELKETLYSFENETYNPTIAYISGNYEEAKLEEELNIALKLLQNIPAGVYNLKTALSIKNNISFKKEVLDFILQGSGVTPEYIKAFADANLNSSKACDLLYIHRNTLLYRMNQFKELSGFDLKEFKDLYILYSLIEK